MTCSSTADSDNNVREILISDVCPSGCDAGSSVSYHISSVVNPSSTKTVNTTYQAGTLTSEAYFIDQSSSASVVNTFFSANSFTSITVNAPTRGIVVGVTTEYQFTIVLKNAIPSSGGIFTITFPSEFTVSSSGSCTATVLAVSHTCVIDSSARTGTITFTANAAAASSLVVTFSNSVQNPTVGQQSSVITFKSTLNDSGTIYDIDSDDSTVTITPNTYGTLTSASVTRVNSSLVSENTNINIAVTSANLIFSGSLITFNLLLDQLVLNVSGFDDVTFYQLDSSNSVGSQLVSSSRTSNSTYYTVVIPEW